MHFQKDHYMTFIHNETLHIFDCDGVILDSNFLKIDSLVIALKKICVPDKLIKKCIGSFKKNFGKTRDFHFSSFAKIFLDEDLPHLCNFINEAECIYTSNVLELYPNAKLIQKNIQFIEKLNWKSECFVVSGSNQEELRAILPNRLNFIKSSMIFGGPTEKTKNVKKILDRSLKNNAVLYGDSISDAKVAIEHDIDFIGLLNHSADKAALFKFCSSYNLKCFNSLVK